MKTNAKVGTILKAIENVSNRYDGNILFKKAPHKVGNVRHFTLTTKDANKAGSLVRSDGVKQRKASAQVYHDLMTELFKLGSPQTIVDNKTVYDVAGTVLESKTKPEAETFTESLKRKYTKTKAHNLAELNRMLQNITDYLQNHPKLLGTSNS
jgi:hypothetical protein